MAGTVILNPLPTQGNSSFTPDPKFYETDQDKVHTDARSQLLIRGPVLTDEESIRDDFTGSTLFTALTGTLTFTNGSTTVTGTGTAFTTELGNQTYIRLGTDANSAFAQVDRIIDDNTLELVNNYTGTGGTGAATSTMWLPRTDGTSSITVGSSLVNLISDGTNGNQVNIHRVGDYLPFVLTAYAQITARNANQESAFGFQDTIGNAQQQAVVVFTGTNAAQVIFRTSRSSAAADTQETTITLPNDILTSAMLSYEINLSLNLASLSINGVVYATHDRHLPDPYKVLDLGAYVKNTGATATTTLSLDTYFFQNTDQVVVANIFRGQPLATSNTSPNITTTGNLSSLNDTVAIPGGTGNTLGINVLGTWVGTVSFEASVDGVTWQALPAAPLGGGALTTSATANGTWLATAGGVAQIRARMIAFTSGTANIVLLTSQGLAMVRAINTDIANLQATTKEVRSPTATLTNVASSAASVTLLAANTSRLGAMIYNDSTQNLFVKFGTTASATSFTVRLASQGYYEVPFGYTGRIDGIWVAANGAARVTEMT